LPRPLSLAALGDVPGKRESAPTCETSGTISLSVQTSSGVRVMSLKPLRPVTNRCLFYGAASPCYRVTSYTGGTCNKQTDTKNSIRMQGTDSPRDKVSTRG
ncbi:hypothetical protein P4O66_005568, partial [Electrophorus voltai]